MRFQFTATFLLVLNASTSSSFGTNAKKIHRGRHVYGSVDRVPFVYGGGMHGSVGSKLFVSVDTPSVPTIDLSSSNLALLSDRGRTALLNLVKNDIDGAQRHIYADWPEAGNDDEGKVRLAEQVRTRIFSSSVSPVQRNQWHSFLHVATYAVGRLG